MDEGHAFTAKPAGLRQRSTRPLLIAAGAAFLLGVVLTHYLGRTLDWPQGSATPSLTVDTGPSPEAAPPAPVETAATDPDTPLTVQRSAADARQIAQVAQQQGGIDQRVAAMEQRLTRLDLQAQAAAGNAARAEGLLIAFAARRAIERGAPLGYLADQLQLRFGDALPNAVEAVLSAGEDPVTIDALLAGLEGLAPVLSQVPSDEGLLPWIGRELSQLFVIRTEETPSPRAENRLERARLFLESGRIEAAVAEVGNMPNADAAAAWIADAERLARAQQALERLETTAILEPRRLRDGSGNFVEQPSPAG